MSRLLDAAYEGNDDELTRLLNSGADVNEINKGYCCLWGFFCLYVSDSYHSHSNLYIIYK